MLLDNFSMMLLSFALSTLTIGSTMLWQLTFEPRRIR